MCCSQWKTKVGFYLRIFVEKIGFSPIGQMKERMTICSRFHDQEKAEKLSCFHHTSLAKNKPKSPQWLKVYVSEARHKTDMCVTIMKDTNFAFQSRVAVFALPCLQLQRLCIIAEEKPDSYDEEIYHWMNKVMAVVNNRHHESVFMIATVHPGSLPRHADGKIDIHEVSARLQKGTLHPSHVICCPHSAIHDLPRSKDRMLGMGPNSIMQGFVVAGASPAQITENPLQEEIEAFIHQQLITRASDEESARKHLIFSNPILPGADYVRMSPLVLHNKAQKMIKHLKSHGAQPRDKVLVSLRLVFKVTAEVQPDYQKKTRKPF